MNEQKSPYYGFGKQIAQGTMVQQNELTPAAFSIFAQIDEVIDRHKNRHGRDTEKWVIILNPTYASLFGEKCEAYAGSTGTMHAMTPGRTPVQYRGYDVLTRSRGKDIELVRESDLDRSEKKPDTVYAELEYEGKRYSGTLHEVKKDDEL